MMLCQDGHRVGADLVGKVPIGGDSVCPYEHSVHFALLHERGGHPIADQRVRDAFPLELVRGETTTLQQRPSLVHIDMDLLARAVGITDDTQCSSFA